MDQPPRAPANSPLGRLLLEETTPVVMVLSTPLAEDARRKNGLDFVRMLLPFCSFRNIDVPVRTASDQPYRLQEFRLQMVYGSEVRQRSPEEMTGLCLFMLDQSRKDSEYCMENAFHTYEIECSDHNVLYIDSAPIEDLVIPVPPNAPADGVGNQHQQPSLLTLSYFFMEIMEKQPHLFSISELQLEPG